MGLLMTPKRRRNIDADESEDEEDEYQQKHKGVQGLIDFENSNQVAQTANNFTQLDHLMFTLAEVGTMKSKPETSHPTGEAMPWSSGQTGMNAQQQPASTASL